MIHRGEIARLSGLGIEPWHESGLLETCSREIVDLNEKKEDTSAQKNLQCRDKVYENTEWLFYGFISHVDPTRLLLAATYIERPQLRPLVVGYKPHGRAQGHKRGAQGIISNIEQKL